MTPKSIVMAALAASASFALLPAPAAAQRQPPSPEQRIERLERQLQQVQRQVFPRGAPASTAGFADEPAATQSSVVTLNQQLEALERQMADILRLSEENGNRLRTLQSELASARSEQDQRIAALERRMAEAAAAAAAAPATTPATTAAEPAKPTPAAAKPAPAKPKAEAAAATGGADAAAQADPGEDAYTVGFRLWEAGQYDQAIASLSSFASAYPRHRRVSFARNLIGRAQLDKGDAREAAATLLANYRTDPDGARAQDSLYYLGQALMKLGQPGQACKAYAELESVYGTKVRADLQKQVAAAKTEARCS